MNQNELGQKYQTYLLRDFFSNKNEFSVPPLNNEETKEKEYIQSQLNEGVQNVVEENVKQITDPFKSLDNSIKAIENMEEILKDDNDLSVLDASYSPLEERIYQGYDNTKEEFNNINHKYQIATIENQTDFTQPERQCYVTSISDGSINLETEEAKYTVSIPHQDYLDMLENPNKYDFTFDRHSEQIYYHEPKDEEEKIVGYESQGLENTPQYRKNNIIEEENRNENER